MERLVAASGHGIELAFGENVAGVGPGVQIPVRGGLGLEERHYCIRRTSGGCEIEDLRSVSGTWINGSLLSGIYLLKPGDLIQAGALALRYEVQETATSPAAETPVTMDGAGPSQEDVLEDDATAKKLQFGQTSEDAAVAKSPSMARSGLVIGATIGTVVLGVFATVAFFLWDSESPIARIQGVLAPAGDESGGTEKAAEERTDKEIFLSDLERWVPTRGMVYHYRDIPRTIATLEKITAWVPEALTKYGIGDVKELVPDKIGSAGIRHSLIFARTGGGSILGNFENNVEFMRIDRPLDDAAWENALEEFVARAAGMSLEMDWAEWEGRLYGEIPAFAALGVAPYAVRILDDKTVVAGPAAEVKALTPLNRTNPAFEAFRRGDEATIAYFDFKKFPDIGLMGIGVRSDFKEGCLAFDFTREVSIRIEAETAGPSSDLKLQAFRNALESVRSRVGGDRTPLGKSLAKFMTGVQLELEGGVARLQVKTSFEDVRVPVERMKELANREEDSSVERLAMHLASVGNAAIAAGSAELKEAHDLETAVFLVERGVRGGVGSEFERTEFRVPRMTDAQFMGISKFLQWE
ncbi:MAG: FHA domain-containing protein [Verrucomicrobiota bacterium]